MEGFPVLVYSGEDNKWQLNDNVSVNVYGNTITDVWYEVPGSIKVGVSSCSGFCVESEQGWVVLDDQIINLVKQFAMDKGFKFEK